MSFGTPSLGSTALGSLAGQSGYFAAGFASTVFGSPEAGFLRFADASGFSSTAFGLPWLQPGYTPGLGQTSSFGTPFGQQGWRVASMNIITKFSTAYYAFTQTEDADGFNPTVFGIPFGAATGSPAVNRSARAAGFISAAFGSPRALFTQTGVAAGYSTGSFGAPSGVDAHVPSPFLPTLFGTPSSAQRGEPDGFADTTFGLATAIRVQPAGAWTRQPRFGTPTAFEPNVRRAYGFTRAGYFGTPRSLRGLVRDASGFNPPVFGSPSAMQRHLVLHIPPGTQFGTPILTRPSEC